MKTFFRGIFAVFAGGLGCVTGLIVFVVLVVVFAAAALGNALPGPLQQLYWKWLLQGVPEQSDAVAELPVGGWRVPYNGYVGPTSFVCSVPVKGQAYLTDCFDTPRRWGYHHGIDYGVMEGTPVFAPMGGKVVYAAFSPVGYGNLVVIENQGYQVFLAHNRDLLVRVGDIVQAGEIVAHSGNTGNSTGPHLHFEVRQVSPRGAVSIDPATVLLPGQTTYCNWYHLVPASEYNTKGCEKGR